MKFEIVTTYTGDFVLYLYDKSWSRYLEIDEI